MAHILVRTAAGVLLIIIGSPAHAVKSASGLVAPGNFGFGAGVTPDPGLYVFSAIAHYDGDIRVYIDGGRTAIDVNKSPFLSGFGSLWVPETKVLGGHLGLSLGSSYNFVQAHGVVTGLTNFAKTIEGSGWGDTTARAQLGWTSGTWSNAFYLTSWFPTGRYELGFQPNTGRNHFGVNLGWGVTYTVPNNSRLEFDSAISVTFNAPNPATHYKNGDEFDWDWAIGKKFSNGIEVGIAGYAYQQLTANSGSGAKLGPFEGRVLGIGPHLVYNTHLMHRSVIFNFHDFQEFDAQNRFTGNLATLTTTVKF